jgi:hypothetical protein
VDAVGGAVRQVRPFHEVTELPFGQAGPDAVAQRRHAEVAEVRAEPQPVDLLGALDLADPDEVPVQVRRRAEPRFQCLVLLDAERSDPGHAVPPGAAPLEFPDGGRDRRGLPGDIGLRREPAGQRQVVVMLDEQRVRLAGRDDDGRLGGHRPAGQPLHRGAGPIGAPDQQVPPSRGGEKARDGVVPCRHLGGGEPGILVGEQGPQVVGQGDRRHRAQSSR